MKEMVEAVRAHAIANYEKDGWDIVVECYDDATLEAFIRHKGATTPAEAIERVGSLMRVISEVRADIQGA